MITNSTITSMIISIYDHNNFPLILAKYCAHCHFMSHNYISQSLTKSKSCESNYNSSQSDSCLFFFHKNMFPKFSTLITTYFQRNCNSSKENTNVQSKETRTYVNGFLLSCYDHKRGPTPMTFPLSSYHHKTLCG